MAPQFTVSQSGPTRRWFFRSFALTLVLGAIVILLVAARPGYAAFYVASTLAALLAGLLWPMSSPPDRGARGSGGAHARPRQALAFARSYRVSLASAPPAPASLGAEQSRSPERAERGPSALQVVQVGLGLLPEPPHVYDRAA
jgi:hypothetical protein